MATTNIELDIENITGVSDADNQFIISAQKFVVSSIPKELLSFAQKASSASTDGSAISFSVNDSITDVQRNGYSCLEIPMGDAIWALDSSSLRYATAKHPVFYHKQGGVHFAPVTDGSNAGYVFYVDYSLIDDDSDLRNAVIFHASAKEFSQLATDGLPSWTSPSLPVAPASPNFGDDLTISSSAPVAPSIPSFTYTDASVTDIIKPLIDISDMASMTESAPSYTKPSVTLEAKPSVTSLSVSATAPVAPSVSTISYSVATNADASAQAVSPITVSTVSKADISGDVPTYTKPVKTAQTAFSAYTSGLSETDPGVFSLASVQPAAPADPSFSTPTISAITIDALPSAPNYTAPVVGGATEEITTTMDADSAGYGTDADFLNFSKWFSVVGDFIEDEEDTELASSQIQKINSYINAYSQAMQNQLNIFNEGNVVYQAAVQKNIQQAQINAQDAQNESNLLLQKENQEYASKLQKYSSDLNKYQADVSKEVQEYQQKLSQYNLELNTSLQAWQKTESDNIQLYQADIQNELNEFNKENARYQANIQAEIAKHNTDLQKAINQAQIDAQDAQQEARQTTEIDQFNKAQDQALALENAVKQMEDDIADNNSKVQKYSAELQQYQADVSKEVQQFQQNLSKELQLWQVNRTTNLQKYASDIQNEVSEFNKENVLYQQDIQRKVQNLQKDVQEAVQNAQNDIAVNNANLGKDVQIALQNAIQDFQQDVQEYGAKIQRYSAELNQYQQDIGKEVQNYTNTLGKETQEYQNKLGLYSADLQKFQSDVAERGQESTVKYQNTQYYEKASDKYYQWAQAEIAQYIQNNSKIINQRMAARANRQDQRQQQRR